MSTTEVQETQSVDKIRDILFGTHIRDYELRFTRLEETIARESADMRESTRRRLDDLEAYVKRELEALDSRFRGERDERGAADDGLSKRITETTDSLNNAQRDLRREALDQSNTLRKELRELNERISELLEKRVGELRHAKTDRAALAGMFNELALRLTDDFKIPGQED